MASTVHTPAPWLHKVAPRRSVWQKYSLIYSRSGQCHPLTCSAQGGDAAHAGTGPRRRALRPQASCWGDRPERSSPQLRRTPPRGCEKGGAHTGLHRGNDYITSATCPQMDFLPVPLPISPPKRSMRPLRSRHPRGKPPGSLFITTLFSSFGSDLVEN